MDVVTSVVDLIGRTPLLRLAAIEPEGGAEIWIKLEQFSPGGSVKDRIALAMIRAAEASGDLAPGGVITEATAGNTGIALTIVGTQLGYDVRIFIPENFSVEKRKLMAALGAEVVVTPVAEGMDGARDRARELAERTPGAVYVDQFANPANPAAHEASTGPEIWEQTGGRIDALVIGMGSGGTFSGAARYLKGRKQDMLAVGVEPMGSALCGDGVTPHMVEGIGMNVVWDIVATDLIDEVIVIEDPPAFAMMRTLARRCGLLAGSSAAANVCAAVQVASRLEPGQQVVTLAPDSSERYLSKEVYDLFAEDR